MIDQVGPIRGIPRKWRVIALLPLIITLMVFAYLVVDVMLNGYRNTSQAFSLFWPLLFLCMSAGMVIASIIRNTHTPEVWGFGGVKFAAGYMAFAGFVLIATMHQNVQEHRADAARATWALSQYCTADGKILSDRAASCAFLINHTKGELCILGAQPLLECEVRLRSAMAEPNSSFEDFSTRDVNYEGLLQSYANHRGKRF